MKTKLKEKFLILIFTALTIINIASCADNNNDVSMEVTDMVQIIMEDGGVIKIELYGKLAPVTVENFKKLVNEGFYDGLIFHRVMKNFMIQCGDPEGTGFGGSDETIFGEFASNNFNNPLKHERGVVSMARKMTGNNTASSQFFICHGDASHLDGDFAAFGKVVEGMDVVDRIAETPTDGRDKPLTEQKIRAVSVIE